MRINVDRLATFFLTPHGIIPFTVLLSFAGWLMPPVFHIMKGFRDPIPLFSQGGAMVLAWYGLIMVLCVIFYAIGRKIRVQVEYFNTYANINDVGAYLAVTLAAMLGFYSVFSALEDILGIRGMIDMLVHQQSVKFNILLLANYHPGLMTLRYCVILSGGLAIYHVFNRGRPSLLDFLNFLLLIGIVLLTNSRLLMVAAFVFGCGLYALNNRPVRVHILKFGLFVCGLFVALTYFNAVRNGHWFKQHGHDNPLSANISEMVTYLGTPFQTSLAVGYHYDWALRGTDYIQLASLDSGLTTNSAFYDLTHFFGLWAWPIMAVQIAAISFIMGMMSHHYRNFLILVYLMLLYILAEFWRINLLFGRGFYFLIACIIVLAIVMSIFNKAFGRRYEVEEETDVETDGEEGHDNEEELEEQEGLPERKF